MCFIQILILMNGRKKVQKTFQKDSDNDYDFKLTYEKFKMKNFVEYSLFLKQDF